VTTRVPEPYERALRGDLRPLFALADGGDASWAVAARALSWFARPEAGEAPSLDAIDQVGGLGAPEALSHVARAAFLTLDHDALEGAYACAAARSLDVRGGLWTRTIGGWLTAMDGDGKRVADEGAVIFREASTAALPVLAIEGTTLAALGRMLSGDVPDAIALARRASRMAQTEHLWLSHYFASVVLARLRRLSGRPHLAGLVASACLAVTPPAFAGFLLWERLFSGLADPDRTPATIAERAWQSAARIVTGRDSHAGDAANDLMTLVAKSAMHRNDAHDLLCALDPEHPVRDGSPVARWVTGVVQETPAALSGLTPPAWADASPDAAPVASSWPKGRSGRRILGFAVSPAFERLAPHGARAARPEAIASALALAGDDGVALPDLFASVYGFAFRRDLHEPTFKVERHRAKKLLEPVADLESTDGRATIRVRTAFVVQDPRCQRPLPDVLLRHLATPGGATARELAERLDVPLRSVQQALKELTADGACVSAREGRKVAYTIEDTTFCELTVS
jgi:DNA-binding transcriptional ArsR family regulator